MKAASSKQRLFFNIDNVGVGVGVGVVVVAVAIIIITIVVIRSNSRPVLCCGHLANVDVVEFGVVVVTAVVAVIADVVVVVVRVIGVTVVVALLPSYPKLFPFILCVPLWPQPSQSLMLSSSLSSSSSSSELPWSLMLLSS